MAEHIETKHDEVNGMSKPGIAGRNQEGNGGSSRRNEHSFHDWLLDKPNGWKLHDNEYALDNKWLASKDVHLGDNEFLWRLYHYEHIREAHGFALGVRSVSKEFWWQNCQCLDAGRLAKLLYFRLEPWMNKPTLTSDCGSDVSEGAEKTSFEIGIVVLIIAST